MVAIVEEGNVRIRFEGDYLIDVLFGSEKMNKRADSPGIAVNGVIGKVAGGLLEEELADNAGCELGGMVDLLGLCPSDK